MSNVSKCFSCARKNDYDPKFGYYGCKLSGQECKGYSMFAPKVKPKPITNADRIRAMTDEELAARVANYIDCEECREMNGEKPCHVGQFCQDFWLMWLKSPVEVDNG